MKRFSRRYWILKEGRLFKHLKTIFQKFLIVGSVSVMFLPTTVETLKAQFFGITLDYPIAYSGAKKNVTGGSIGINHPIPFIPNFGYSTLTFEELEEQENNDGTTIVSLDTKVKLQSVNLFYQIPFPVVSMSLGIGYGTLTPTTKVTKTQTGLETSYSNTELSVPVSEGFIHIGLPYWNIIEFHIGYHAFSTSSVYRNKNNSTFNQNSSETGIDFKKANYSGGMMTIGIQIAF